MRLAIWETLLIFFEWWQTLEETIPYDVPPGPHPSGHFFKLPPFLKLTNTDPFVAWLVLTVDATPDGIRVVRPVLGAIISLSIVAFTVRALFGT